MDNPGIVGAELKTSPQYQADFGPVWCPWAVWCRWEAKGSHSLCPSYGPPPCTPSPSLYGLWAESIHMYLGWASVSWAEWGRRARPEALLVHILAGPEDPRPGPPTPAPGAGGGRGSPAGGAPLCPHHRPLQVGSPHHPLGQGPSPFLGILPLTPPVPSALSAGIGRTGCFIATSICCQQLRQEGVVDILKTTCQLRQDRSAQQAVVGAHGGH